MVARRQCAGRRRWAGASLQQAPVVDLDHVLGPLASREVTALLEAHQPVVGIFGPDDQERPLFFDDGELTIHLKVQVVHAGQTRTLTMPSSTITS